MDELWRDALAEIKEQLGKQNFDAWIKPIRFNSQNKNEILLDVPNKFFRDWLVEHHLRLIEQVLSSIAHHELKVCLNVDHQLQTKETAEKIEKKEEREREKPNRANNLIPKYTFENFVIGASPAITTIPCSFMGGLGWGKPIW